jgi:hypothetical protein
VFDLLEDKQKFKHGEIWCVYFTHIFFRVKPGLLV